MTRFANTIEFEGHKAVINSYSDHPLLVANMEAQLASWKALYPNATVKTEVMEDLEIMRLVAMDQTPLRSLPHEIGQTSNI